MSFSSLVPVFMGRDWWDAWDYPSRIMDQCFATPLLDSDLLAPQLYRGFVLRPRTQANVAASGQSEVKNDDQQFQVSLNVSQFKPEEIQVKVVDNYVEIHAKHEEKSMATCLASSRVATCSRGHARAMRSPLPCLQTGSSRSWPLNWPSKMSPRTRGQCPLSRSQRKTEIWYKPKKIVMPMKCYLKVFGCNGQI